MKEENKKTRLQQIISDSTSVEADTLKTAFEEFEKEKKEQKGKEILRNLQNAQQTLNNAVRILQEVRKKEKVAKKRVLAIDNAMIQYSKDADEKALSKVINGY